ncbi:MAG: recombination protein RecR [Elusimicrobiaceae bacterium]|nr:recombination protein RecR [Elusimicrobiaceae bacterium]MBT4403001.1 recombination protein RecR [Elusimicrobiaceae bacterium]MBT4439727.1 recombination protein RecR [Elusimicrobiaceae bacterium]MBT5987828.1 recombination protein RecR [Elusimicrobiaceae bacterium]MBT6714929.1 recombination protein RecR [Elusimicrobiaceae bacterium]
MKSLNRLISAFRRLPGVGPKQAERFSSYFLKASEAEANELCTALQNLKKSVKLCSNCLNYCENDLCHICKDEARDRTSICIVEKPKDIELIERTKIYNGLYHVLHGTISPVSAKEIGHHKIKQLAGRVDASDPKILEIILATNPDTEGENTALYIADVLKGSVENISRLGYGMPLGADIEYTDELTLSYALKGRTKV